MKLIPALLTTTITVVVAWLATMWAFILLGHVLYPDNLHNGIALSGVLVFGPLGGVVSGFLVFRKLRKSN